MTILYSSTVNYTTNEYYIMTSTVLSTISIWHTLLILWIYENIFIQKKNQNSNKNKKKN